MRHDQAEIDRFFEWTDKTFPARQGTQVFWEYKPTRDRMELTVYFYDDGVKYRGDANMELYTDTFIETVNKAIENAEPAQTRNEV